MIVFCNVVHYKCNVLVWNWSNTIILIALWILMAWCFGTGASLITMLNMRLCVSSCLVVDRFKHYNDVYRCSCYRAPLWPCRCRAIYGYSDVFIYSIGTWIIASGQQTLLLQDMTAATRSFIALTFCIPTGSKMINELRMSCSGRYKILTSQSDCVFVDHFCKIPGNLCCCW